MELTSPRPPEGTEPGTLHWLRYEHAGCVWNEVDQWGVNGWRLRSRTYWTYLGPAHPPGHPYMPTTKEVVAALMPFVAPGGGWDMQAFHDIHDDIIVWENSGQCVTAGDVRVARRIVAKFLNEPISEMHFRRTDQNCLAPLLVRAAREIEDTHEGRLSGDTYDRRATLLADIRAAGVSWDTETVEGTVVGFVEPQRNMGE